MLVSNTCEATREPPYGVDWKGYAQPIKDEAAREGGRFSAGLPRVSDGSLLFLQHMLSHIVDDGRKGSQ